MLNIYSNSKNFHLNSHTTCTTHIPYVLHINIQVGRVSGQPGLVVGEAACGRGVETRWSYRSFSSQAILWFYECTFPLLISYLECNDYFHAIKNINCVNGTKSQSFISSNPEGPENAFRFIADSWNHRAFWSPEMLLRNWEITTFEGLSCIAIFNKRWGPYSTI